MDSYINHIGLNWVANNTYKICSSFECLTFWISVEKQISLICLPKLSQIAKAETSNKKVKDFTQALIHQSEWWRNPYYIMFLTYIIWSIGHLSSPSAYALKTLCSILRTRILFICVYIFTRSSYIWFKQILNWPKNYAKIKNIWSVVVKQQWFWLMLNDFSKWLLFMNLLLVLFYTSKHWRSQNNCAIRS